jgi:hypothetical protein
MSSDVPSSFPIVNTPVNTAPVTRRVQDMYRRIAQKPDLELVEITGVIAGLLTCRKIGTTTTIPGVVPIGWTPTMTPAVGEFVWIMTPSPGANPIALGTPVPNNPRTKVYQSGAFNLLNNAFTIFNMDATNWTEEYDQVNGHDFVTNNSRIPIARDGIYAIEAAVSFGANAAGIRGCYVVLNGVTIQTKLTNTSNGVFGDTVNVSLHKECVAGNYIEFGYYQNSGGLLACITGIGNTFLSVVRIGDLG